MTGLIIDSFAVGGGASPGIELATGRSLDIAINHDAEAIAMQALLKDPDHRQQSAGELADQIEAVIGRVTRGHGSKASGDKIGEEKPKKGFLGRFLGG